MTALKHIFLSALTVPGVRTALRPARNGVGTIFMLHRFTDPETGVIGDDPAELRATLAFLRRRGYQFVELGELFRRLHEDDRPEDFGVAFTLDDGYADQVRVAGPVFAEFDCPATVFVTTGFLDRKLWFWWDRIEYLFANTRRSELSTEIGGDSVSYRWDPVPGPAEARGDFINRCKQLPDHEKHRAIDRLALAAEVALPEQAPARYAPMDWPELRSWEAKGMTFGPHTVTHPILARVTDAQSRSELSESWRRLQAEAAKPAPVFCYPNGQPGDFGPREISTLRELGLRGAVVGTPGYASAAELRTGPEAAFTVSRFNYPGDYRVLSQYVTGLERLRSRFGRTK